MAEGLVSSPTMKENLYTKIINVFKKLCFLREHWSASNVKPTTGSISKLAEKSQELTVQKVTSGIKEIYGEGKVFVINGAESDVEEFLDVSEHAIQASPSILILTCLDKLCPKKSVDVQNCTTMVETLLHFVNRARREGCVLIIGLTKNWGSVNDALLSSQLFKREY